MRTLWIGWALALALGCGPRVGPANASFHHQITAQFSPAAGASDAPSEVDPGAGEVAVLTALPRGFRTQSTNGRVGVARDFPTPEDPHRYLGELRVKVTVRYEDFKPDDEELTAERRAIVRERDRLASERARALGGNAVVLNEDSMRRVTEPGWWWRGVQGARGYTCDEGGKCVRHWASYSILYVSKESRRAPDGKAALARLVPAEYQPVLEGQKLSEGVVVPLSRDHCYVIGVAIHEASADALPEPVSVHLQGLTAGGKYISSQSMLHTMTLDNDFTRGSIANLACSPITEKQTIKLNVPEGAAAALSWSLFARRMKPEEGLKEYCWQCSGEAHACGGQSFHASCQRLTECLQTRKVTLAKCRQHFPSVY